jgi:hypothetical protein
MHTNASDSAIGGVLVQDVYLSAFESWKLNDAKQKYSIHEREMMAMVRCLGI